MSFRNVLLLGLTLLCAAAGPASAASTDQEKFIKKVARYAQPITEVDPTKPRGLCTCSAGDAVAIEGQTGVLAYGVESAVMISIVDVFCLIPAFDASGAFVATQTCKDWTLLRR
jgi:hypothetical protein